MNGDPEASRLCYHKGRRDFQKEGVVRRRTVSEVETDGDREVTGCVSAQRALATLTDAISVPWWRQESLWGWLSRHRVSSSGRMRGLASRTACKYSGPQVFLKLGTTETTTLLVINLVLVSPLQVLYRKAFSSLF